MSSLKITSSVKLMLAKLKIQVEFIRQLDAEFDV